MRFDPAVKEFYREHGAALQKGAFEPEHLELLARGVARNLENPSPGSGNTYQADDGSGEFRYDYGCHGWIPEYTEFVKASGLAEAAAEMLSSRRVCFFDDSYFVKQAGCEIPSPWHHDYSYYQIEGEILIAWVPLDPHGAHESLRLVAGSHRWGKEFAPLDFDPVTLAEGRLAPGQTSQEPYNAIPDLDGGDYDILAWQVEPGDCVFFNGLTLHGSRGNPTPHAQRRFNCRFVDEGATYQPRRVASSGAGTLGVGIGNAPLQPGQRLSDDPESFPIIWQADTARS